MGAWWGYFSTANVHVTGNTATFRRKDRTEPSVDAHFCPICGVTTHWVLLPHVGSESMGVNMRLFDIRELRGIEIRFPDGAGWDGSSPYGYRRVSTVIGSISH
jgi:hypothetical protein